MQMCSLIIILLPWNTGVLQVNFLGERGSAEKKGLGIPALLGHSTKLVPFASLRNNQT